MKVKNLPGRILLLSLQCLLCTTLFAQITPPSKQWDKRFGGANGDEAHCVRQTSDGGYIAGGVSASHIDGDKTEDSRGGSDYWIVKMDANGVKQWDKRFGGSADDQIFSLQQTTDGGYVLGGRTESPVGGDLTKGSRGNYDYWVVKIDSTGVKEWDKRFGNYSIDRLTSLQQTTDGGYILGGWSFSPAGGDKTQNNWGSSDYWVVKIDKKGIKQWDKVYGGYGDEVLSSIQQTADGGYILGGISGSDISGDKTEKSRGFDDYWIIKIDANGVKQWDKRFGGSHYEYFSSIRQTADKGYILGGYTSSGKAADVSEVARGSYDYWIVKTDSNGVKQWDKRFGGTKRDQLEELQQTADGGYILGGWSASGIGADKTEANMGKNDYWVVKTDANGLKEWDKNLGGTDEDLLYSVQQTKEGNYIAAGGSRSGISGDRTEANWGYDDFWIVQLGCNPQAGITADNNADLCATGSVVLTANKVNGFYYKWYKGGAAIADGNKRTYTATVAGKYKVRIYSGNCSNYSNELRISNSCGLIADNSGSSLSKTNNQLATVTVYPNPSKGNISLTYKSLTSGEIQLNIFDITSEKLFTKTVQAVAGNNHYQLNVSALAAGMYTLQVNNNTIQQQVKLVINK